MLVLEDDDLVNSEIIDIVPPAVEDEGIPAPAAIHAVAVRSTIQNVMPVDAVQDVGDPQEHSAEVRPSGVVQQDDQVPLLRDPDVLIFDEATSALDRSATVGIEQLVAAQSAARVVVEEDEETSVYVVTDGEVTRRNVQTGITADQQVEILSPGFGETRERMRDIWIEWADTNVHEGRLRAAAERLEEAAKIPGERARAASVQAAAVTLPADGCA